MIPPVVIAGIRNQISLPIVAPQVHHDAGWAPVPYTGRNFMRKFLPPWGLGPACILYTSPRQDALDRDATARDIEKYTNKKNNPKNHSRKLGWKLSPSLSVRGLDGLVRNWVYTEELSYTYHDDRSGRLHHFSNVVQQTTHQYPREEVNEVPNAVAKAQEIRNFREAQRRIKELEEKIRDLEKRIPQRFPDVKYLNYRSRKRILITGGAGFVGSHLVDRLMMAGHEVIVADNFFTGRKQNVEHWIGHENFELIHHDIVNPLYIEVDEIYHLASPASPPHYMYNPVKTIKTNTVGTINMLGLAKRVGAKVLIASTSEVYGDPEVHPQPESYWGHVNPIGPRACYDEGKRVAETLSYAYAKQEKVDVRVARIFNTFGPRMHMNDGRVVSNFILQALKDEPITVRFLHLPNLTGENPQTIRENTEILLEASKEIGLEVNPEKTKYMIMSRDQNILRNGTIKVGDLSFEEVEKFKYLGATVTNVNDTREEIKHRINMGNACYYSVEKLLSSSLLSKNPKVRIYKTVILPVVLYGCETWTLTLREEQRLRVFENKVLRKIFGAKRDEVTGEWRKLHNTELHALYPSLDIIRNIKSRRLRWAGHVARMGESRNAYRIYGHGKQTRSFQYVSDLVDGLIALMASNYTLPVNLGNPTEHTIEEFAFMIKELVGKSSTIKQVAAVEDDPQRRKPDISRAKKYLGWEPKVPLIVGLRKTVHYFEKELQRATHEQRNSYMPEERVFTSLPDL
ncbi:hypothetical protein ANN_24193 [Periplaneta americana]|uniref:UDP-glucuronate decarboxylase n=1 Tax=Periplaneta americana TaxID=6978 RepID=A0ABQ8S2M1_PERAM|nr:hypothetical protein ANN_24193 [Periplaneta americana]